MSLEEFKTLGSGSVSGQSVPIPDGYWVEWLLPYNGADCRTDKTCLYELLLINDNMDTMDIFNDF